MLTHSQNVCVQRQYCFEGLHVPQSTVLCDKKYHHVQMLEVTASLVRAVLIVYSSVTGGEVVKQQPAGCTAAVLW